MGAMESQHGNVVELEIGCEGRKLARNHACLVVLSSAIRASIAAVGSFVVDRGARENGAEQVVVDETEAEVVPVDRLLERRSLVKFTQILNVIKAQTTHES